MEIDVFTYVITLVVAFVAGCGFVPFVIHLWYADKNIEDGDGK